MNRSLPWGWVFAPLYVLSMLLFVFDSEFGHKAIKDGNKQQRCTNHTQEVQEHIIEYQKQNIIHQATPKNTIIFVAKVALLATILLANLKLSGKQGSLSSTCVFVPFYTWCFVIALLLLRRHLGSLLAVVLIITFGLLPNLYTLGIIHSFACVLIPYDAVVFSLVCSSLPLPSSFI